MLFLRLSLVGGLLAVGLSFAQDIAHSNGTTGVNCACTQLASTYGSLVLTSNSTDYTAERIDYWDIRADLFPGCIFLPATADQVADAVSIFTSCGAKFAIRGGGHMPGPGSNNINGGVLLALNNLTTLQVASDKTTIEVGPGNRWIDVYSALSEYGLYCIGGRMRTIGVPGLELIGGFHYLINKYGMAMDNVVSYDVVLANATQITANSTSNSELFWALKGGANNFGIVTKFTIQTLDIPLISTTIQAFAESSVQEFITATANSASYDSPDIAAGSIITIGYDAPTGRITPTLLGVQEGTESPPSRFANFSAISSLLTINNVTTPLQWHNTLDTPFYIQFAHKTIKPDADQIFTIYQAWKAAINEVSDVEGLGPTFVLNIMPKSAASVAKNNGIGNTWGLDDEQSLMIWQLSTSWANAADDSRLTDWARSFIHYWHQENQAKGLASEFIYMGDAGEFQNPFAGYPPENVQRMKEIRDVYDPTGVFSILNPGGFKLER